MHLGLRFRLIAIVTKSSRCAIPKTAAWPLDLNGDSPIVQTNSNVNVDPQPGSKETQLNQEKDSGITLRQEFGVSQEGNISMTETQQDDKTLETPQAFISERRSLCLSQRKAY